jgi:hypothetical protein
MYVSLTDNSKFLGAEVSVLHQISISIGSNSIAVYTKYAWYFLFSIPHSSLLSQLILFHCFPPILCLILLPLVHNLATTAGTERAPLSRTSVGKQTSSYRTISAGALGDQPVIPSGTAAEVECQASDTALRYDPLSWCRPTRWGRVLPSFGLTSVISLVCVQGMKRPGSNTTHQLMARLSLAQ